MKRLCAQKMLDAEKDSDATLEKLQRGYARKGGRQIPAPDVKSEGEGTVEEVSFYSVIRSYHYSGPDTIQSRKQAKDFAAQRMSRRVQAIYWVTHMIWTYIDRVESKSNLADGPSRNCLTCCKCWGQAGLHLRWAPWVPSIHTSCMECALQRGGEVETCGCHLRTWHGVQSGVTPFVSEGSASSVPLSRLFGGWNRKKTGGVLRESIETYSHMHHIYVYD